MGTGRSARVAIVEVERLTVSRAAALVGVHKDTVRAWVREGRLRTLRTLGGHHRIEPADLLRFHAAWKAGKDERARRAAERKAARQAGHQRRIEREAARKAPTPAPAPEVYRRR